MTDPDDPLTTSLAALGSEAIHDRELDTALLDAELPDDRFRDPTYLHWLYDRNPFGPAYQDHVDDDGVRVAHYGLVPQRYRSPMGTFPFVFSLNAIRHARGANGRATSAGSAGSCGTGPTTTASRSSSG